MFCQCFNIDVKRPRIFTGPKDALFGFSVLQHEADGEKSYVRVDWKQERSTNNSTFHDWTELSRCTLSVLMMKDFLLKVAGRCSLGRTPQQQERRRVQMHRGRGEELKLQQNEYR